MSFSRRAEILFDPKVYFEAPDLKPYSTSLCQVSRLRHFRNTQQVGIKMFGLLFASNKHGELNVMDSGDFAFAHEGRTSASSQRFSHNLSMCFLCYLRQH